MARVQFHQLFKKISDREDSVREMPSERIARRERGHGVSRLVEHLGILLDAWRRWLETLAEARNPWKITRRF